jgi:hypothetical protein
LFRRELGLGRIDAPYGHNGAIKELMRAVGHSLVGNTERASYHHGQAKIRRGDLVRGRADRWADSWMQMIFDQFEPMIEDR